MNCRTTARALLLIFFFAKYSYAGTPVDPRQTTPVIRKYGIDEQGRSFEYTVPAAGLSVAGAPPRPTPSAAARTAKRYGIDEQGRSFEYAEGQVAQPLPPSGTAAAPRVTRAAAVSVAPAKGSQSSPLSGTLLSGSQRAATAIPSPTVPAARRNATGVPPAVSVPTAARTTAAVSPVTRLKAGSVPARDPQKTVVTTHAGNKVKKVHRLLFARYHDRAYAYRVVGKLQSRGQKAYIISRKGAHSVYCGSYFSHQRAKSQQRLIASRGIRVTITG